jgi:hypothetical protein
MVLPPTGQDGSLSIFEKEIVPERTGRWATRCASAPTIATIP